MRNNNSSLPGLGNTVLSHCVTLDGFTALMGASKGGHTNVKLYNGTTSSLQWVQGRPTEQCQLVTS